MIRKLFSVLMIFFVIIFSFISCNSTEVVQKEPPLWANIETLNAVYPKEKYIAKIGYGSSTENALANAESELGKYFEHNIKTNIIAEDYFTSKTGDDTERNQELKKEIFISSNVNLLAVNHTRPWFDRTDDLYVVCAYIDRQEAFELYEPKLENGREEFYTFYNKALAESDPLKKINRLKETVKAANKYLEILNFAQLISPACGDKYAQDIEKISSIEEMIYSAKMDATMNISVNEDYDGRIESLLKALMGKEKIIISSSDYKYSMEVKIQKDFTIHELDYNETMCTADPSISINIINYDSGENLFTYSKTFPKIKGYNDIFVNKKVYKAIEDEINNSFVNELNNFIK